MHRRKKIIKLLTKNNDYINVIKNFKTKYINLDNNREIEIPKYPLLLGETISEDYFANIYRYLFVVKHNLYISRYQLLVNEIKEKNKRDNKKNI